MKKQVLDKIIEKASKIWVVDAQTLSADTIFADLNPKSAHYSQLTTYLEDEFDMEVPFMEFKRCLTFGDAADFVVELIED